MKNCKILLILLFAAKLFGATKPEPTRAEVYKTASGSELKIFIFEPDGHKASEKRPAVVFFFGGGWNGGTPSQFYAHCEYLASMHGGNDR